MFSNRILKTFSPLLNVQRSLGRRSYKWFDEGVQYPGFKYYPRSPDLKDPPYEPTKLFRVRRIKSLKGLPWWEKNILKEFKLDGKEFAVIKNIPENNFRLWKVKHAIEIVPITFPDGFPKENDRTYLKENGELRIIKSIGPIEQQLQLSEEFAKLPERMDGDTLRRNLRKKWLNGYESVV